MLKSIKIYCKEVEEDVVVDYVVENDRYRECACSQNDDHHCAYKINKRCDVLNDLFLRLKNEN